MTTQRYGRALAACFLAALLTGSGALAGPVAAAEPETINAFSVWQAAGQVYQTGENTAMFLGALQGPLYIDTPEGPVLSGTLVCPAKLDISLADNAQSGEGRCTVTGADGAQVFATWTCSGFHLIGCAGEFSLTGGTGRFAGISGAGPVTFRSSHRAIAPGSAGAVATEAATGIVFWRGLTYQIPGEAK